VTILTISFIFRVFKMLYIFILWTTFWLLRSHMLGYRKRWSSRPLTSISKEN